MCSLRGCFMTRLMPQLIMTHSDDNGLVNVLLSKMVLGFSLVFHL